MNGKGMKIDCDWVHVSLGSGGLQLTSDYDFDFASSIQNVPGIEVSFKMPGLTGGIEFPKIPGTPEIPDIKLPPINLARKDKGLPAQKVEAVSNPGEKVKIEADTKKHRLLGLSIKDRRLILTNKNRLFYTARNCSYVTAEVWLEFLIHDTR